MAKKQDTKKEHRGKLSDPVHVRLERPVALRKNILGATIEVTKMLKTYAELKYIRDIKATVLNKYRSIHNDINGLVRHFEREDLPPVPLYELDEKIERKKIKEEKIVVKGVTDGEIEKLKEELANIESKLNKL